MHCTNFDKRNRTYIHGTHVPGRGRLQHQKQTSVGDLPMYTARALVCSPRTSLCATANQQPPLAAGRLFLRPGMAQ
jgi:hypothetical protein